MGKRPTQAAWKRMLTRYEEDVLNPALAFLSDDEKNLLYQLHDLLRLRASGGK